MKTNKNISIIFTLIVLTLALSACSNPLAKDDKTDKVGETTTVLIDDKIDTEEEKNKDKIEDETGDKENIEDEKEDMGDEEKSDDDNKDAAAVDEENKKTEETQKVERAEKEVVPEPQPEKTMLILDASGSMWGQIDGTPKIDIAKDVLKTTVKEFDGQSELGLMAYGHREKGNCEDIEIMTEPKENNSSTIATLVDSISPKGMTPMGASVLMAAENLKYTEDKATVILISDGIETCDVDLCALGKKLEETGVDFTAHVIGFDMTEEQTAGLKCLASETGGQFMAAKDADSLSDAIGKAVEASACSAEKLGKVEITAPAKVSAGSDFEIDWTSERNEYNENDFIMLVEKGSTEWSSYIERIHPSRDIKTMTAPEDEKEYDLVFFDECGAILGRTTFVVESVSAGITSYPTTVPIGADFNVDWIGPNNGNDFVMLVEKGASSWSSYIERLHAERDTKTMTAPGKIGEFDIVYITSEGNVLDRKTFTTTPVSVSLTVPETAVAGEPFLVDWDAPNYGGDFIMLMPKGSSRWGDYLSRTYASRDARDLTAPDEIGDYDVIYMSSDNNIWARETIKITN